MSDHTQTWAKVLGAVRDHHDGLVESGDVDVDGLALEVRKAEKRIEALKLVNGGMSVNAAAKAVGVPETTVRRDIRQNGETFRQNGSVSKNNSLALGDLQFVKKQAIADAGHGVATAKQIKDDVAAHFSEFSNDDVRLIVLKATKARDAWSKLVEFMLTFEMEPR